MLLPLCLALLFWGCQPKDPLPRATRFGANTFGCKINGKTYIPDGGGSFSGIKPIYGGFYWVQSNPVKRGIYIQTSEPSGQVLNLFIADYRPGVYELNETTRPLTQNLQNFGFYQNGKGGIAYITSTDCIGSVKINKADTLSGIVSSTFSLSPCSTIPGPGQTIGITEGRFDIGSR